MFKIAALENYLVDFAENRTKHVYYGTKPLHSLKKSFSSYQFETVEGWTDRQTFDFSEGIT